MSQPNPTAQALIEAARRLSAKVDALSFAPPVSHVYNPLDYAWAPHEKYLRRYGAGKKRIVIISRGEPYLLHSVEVLCISRGLARASCCRQK